MSDNKKYYYLKLKEDFFTSETITLLESMKDGVLYANILLKLYLMSFKNNGRLMLSDHHTGLQFSQDSRIASQFAR